MRKKELSAAELAQSEGAYFTSSDLDMLERVLLAAEAELLSVHEPGASEDEKRMLAAAIFAHVKLGERDPASLTELALADVLSLRRRPEGAGLGRGHAQT